MWVHKSLAFVLVSMVALPGYGNPAAVGIVQSSNAATTHGANLVPGTTVYSGDTIDVGARGNAQISFRGSSQLLLAAGSRAELMQPAASEPVRVEVEQGIARFRSSAVLPVIAVLGDATIRTEGADGIGAIRVVNSKSALISAEKGSLVVETDGAKATTVPQGMALTVTMVQAASAQAGAAANGQGSNGKKKKILVGVLIIGAAVAAGVALNQGENSNNPSLSPFVP